jgi:Flp pilus assembly protein TadD
MKYFCARFLFILFAGLPIQAAVTFTHDVAPIVFQHCAGCHRPGQSAPFPLLTFTDCRKHAADLADVTARHFMPPWLTSGSHGEFVGDRRITAAEIAVFRAWAVAGTPEGDPQELPALPDWPAEWQLGPPDALAQMPAPYLLSSGGRDVYRHFALPLTKPLDRPRWVRAFEFHPGSRQVHHAFLYLARTNDSRRLDAADSEIGFGGMDTPPEVRSPGGYFLSWQPGKRVQPLPPGLGWKLEPGMDLIVQMHLQPGGKTEPIPSSVGLWFSEMPATNQPLKFGLNIYDLDLAPGKSNLVYGREFVLPGDSDLLGVLPHTHYLGRRIEAWAELPDQTRRDLLTIPDWDFNWQGDYRYSAPVFLPRGTRVQMRFVFDNTVDNPRNPSNPPRRVGFGMSTSDEMAEVWFQLLPRTGADRAALDRAIAKQTVREVIAYNELRLRENPTNAIALVNLGRARLVSGDRTGAFRDLARAVALNSVNDEGHYYLGVIHRMEGRLADAISELKSAVAANPQHGRALGNLGLLAREAGRSDEAADYFSAALRSDPDDNLARTELAQIRLNQGRRTEAISLIEEAILHSPEDTELAANLAKLKALK